MVRLQKSSERAASGGRMIRAWGAVWRNNRPEVEIRDIPNAELPSPRDSDFRYWRAAIWDDGDKKPPKNYKKNHDAPDCGPKKPCDKCRVHAPYWWYQWETLYLRVYTVWMGANKVGEYNSLNEADRNTPPGGKIEVALSQELIEVYERPKIDLDDTEVGDLVRTWAKESL